MPARARSALTTSSHEAGPHETARRGWGATRLWLCLGLLFAALSLTPNAWAETRWYLQLPEQGVNEALARRSLTLELRDLQVPPNPEIPGDSADQVSLFLDVRQAERGWTVTLWDRGTLAGKRTISEGGHPSTMGRRVALAASELVRELIARRRRQALLLAQEAEEREERQRLAVLRERREAPSLVAEASGVFLPEGAWLAGPGLAWQFNGHHPLRMQLGLAWRAGRVDALMGASLASQAPSWSELELHLGAAWVGRLSWLELAVGPRLSVGAVHLSGGGRVDGIMNQRDTWSSRLSLGVDAKREFGEHLLAGAFLQGGHVLRPLPMAIGDDEIALGGGFVSVGLSMAVKP